MPQIKPKKNYFPNTAKIAEKSPSEPAIMIRPASKTPSITAMTVCLNFIFNKLAAKVPVQAPVPGNGIPTKSKSARKTPRPAFS